MYAIGHPQWRSEVPEEDMGQVRALLDRIDQLKKSGLTAVAIAIDFVHHSIQPLKDRVYPAYHYSGINDPTRETDRRVGREEIIHQISLFFNCEITNLGAPKSYSLFNPAPEVS